MKYTKNIFNKLESSLNMLVDSDERLNELKPLKASCYIHSRSDIFNFNFLLKILCENQFILANIEKNTLVTFSRYPGDGFRDSVDEYLLESCMGEIMSLLDFSLERSSKKSIFFAVVKNIISNNLEILEGIIDLNVFMYQVVIICPKEK